MLASGSNDNMCLVWDARGGSFSAPASMAASPLHVFSESCAAINGVLVCLLSAKCAFTKHSIYIIFLTEIHLLLN